MADKTPRLKPIEPGKITGDARYDVLVIPANAGFRAANKAVHSLIMSLNFRGFAKPVDEAVTNEWLEVYCDPGPAAHEVFYERAWARDEPAFLECVVYAGDDAADLDYGPKRPIYFAIEFRGCLFKEPLGPFRKLLKDSLNFRASIHVRDHEGLPPHKTVDEDGNASTVDETDKKSDDDSASTAASGRRSGVGLDIEEW